MGLIDSHAHLTFPQLREDIDSVLQRSIEAGVDAWITVGTDTENNLKAIDLANRYDNLYATVGFHPHYAKDVTQADLDLLHEQARHNKVVAIGEIGLDYFYNFSSHADQRRIFQDQLVIASAINKPVVIHSRDAMDDTFSLLDEFRDKLAGVVIHCLGGDDPQLIQPLDRGFHISFTGVVTFKNADKARQAAAVVPLDRLMVETDCPYMSPAPMRSQKTNEPSLMIHTAAKLAQIKGVSLEEFAMATEKTTRDFFLPG